MRNAKTIARDLRELRREMRECHIRKTSCFNGGLDSDTYRANARRFALETELGEARKTLARLNQALCHPDSAWGFFHGTGQGERALMDSLLVESRHELAMQPGTVESRFRALAKSGFQFAES